MTSHTAMPRTVHRHGSAVSAPRELAEETAIALSYNGTTQAVMMATPADLEDFGLGFSLSEGLVEAAGEIESLEVIAHDLGLEIAMWLAPARADALAERRRHMAGPVGCGLCGLDSLEAALRPAARLTAAGPRLARHDITAALAALRETQALHDTTRAVHAAGLYTPGRGLLAAREDVGRHNALDKLAGAAARRELDTSQSAVVLTSRVSVDLVQKTARLGAPVLIAVSAPTAHAVRLADEAGLTLIASARDDGFEVYTHPNRLDPGAAVHVA
jgi:FdhD protein